MKNENEINIQTCHMVKTKQSQPKSKQCMTNRAVNKSTTINVQTNHNPIKLTMHPLYSTTEQTNDSQATKRKEEYQR